MHFTSPKITEIFYLADEFCKEFNLALEPKLLGNTAKRKPKMSTSEVITIMILFHAMGYRNMKHFYLYHVKKHLASDFPQTVSYTRFTELMQSATLPMTIFLKTCCLGECTGISFIDSTPVRVCKNKRIKRNKVFKGIAEVGKSTMGNCLMEMSDKILLRKRSIIETINDELKNICQIEHSRHRSFENFISNLILA
jgi:hypothetical protein